MGEILEDRLTQIANKNWAPGSEPKSEFDSSVVEDIYKQDLTPGKASQSRAVILEYSCYLENYLWPNFSSEASFAHVMSIILMLNEKFRENIPAWEAIRKDEGGQAKFTKFFIRVLNLKDEPLSIDESTAFLHFLINSFQSLEEEMVRRCVLRLVSLPLWKSLTPGRVNVELNRFPRLRKEWKLLLAASAGGKKKKKGAAAKKAAAAAADADSLGELESTFLPAMLDRFFAVLASLDQGAQAEAEEGSDGDGDTGMGEAKGEKSEAAGEEASVQQQEQQLASAPVSSRVLFCCRFAELLVDLLSQLPTRRFFRSLAQDAHVCTRARLSCLGRPRADEDKWAGLSAVTPQSAAGEEGEEAEAQPQGLPCGRLFRQLLGMVEFYETFEINDQTGSQMTDADVSAVHYGRVSVLQRLAFKYYDSTLQEFALRSTGSVGSAAALTTHLSQLDTAQLRELAGRLRLLPSAPLSLMDGGAAKGGAGTIEVAAPGGYRRVAVPETRELLMKMLVTYHTRRASQLKLINALPLYPNEQLLWDEHLVPVGRYDGGSVLALPKLNLQFLTFHDYLLRSFHLFRLEAAYEIRQDLVDTIRRMAPKRDAVGETVFTGWARMATTIAALTLTEVSKPALGEAHPASVKAELTFNTSSMHPGVKQQWESFREHDIVFLVAIDCPPPATDEDGNVVEQQPRSRGEEDCTFPLRYGVKSVRAAEVYELMDEERNPMNDVTTPLPKGGAVGTSRILRLRLDPAQYTLDMGAAAAGKGDVYPTLNLVIRRNAKENNFKGVLETIRDLMNVTAVGKAVPGWLHDVFLGYGDPAAAHYSVQAASRPELSFADTFLDSAHVVESFPDHKVIFKSPSGQPLTADTASPPFKLKFLLPDESPAAAADPNAEAAAAAAAEVAAEKAAAAEQATAAAEKAAAAAKAADAAVNTPKRKGRRTPSKKQRMASAKKAAKAVETTAAAAEAATAAAAQAQAAAESAAAAAAASAGGSGSKGSVVVTPYRAPHPGPYPSDQPKVNSVRFTHVQAEAIRSGMNAGLTMVVGPPGTGKTDTAVQIISNLYHNFPRQRTLLVTHSNQALNDLFEKIMERDVEERHLLRMGSGQQQLSTDKDFSKHGRVNATLARRLHLLSEVERLAFSLHVRTEAAYTCEAAGHFFLYHVVARWEEFRALALRTTDDATCISRLFPFHAYFATAPAVRAANAAAAAEAEAAAAAEAAEIDAAAAAAAAADASGSTDAETKSESKGDGDGDGDVAIADASDEQEEEEEEGTTGTRKKPTAEEQALTSAAAGLATVSAPTGAGRPSEALFGKGSWEENMAVAEGCFRHLEHMFEELEEYRAFELLRSGGLRGDYLLTKQARIIAMTCTHAAITRRRLVKLGFKFDNIVMEEAAQILEVETFIPMLLQNFDEVEGCRLKRVVLIGDHNQLPPVVQNMAFQKYGGLDQSLFTRFVRLGTPTVQLHLQGRARPCIADLYRWRYNNLGDLPRVGSGGGGVAPEYSTANAGFALPLQLVNVGDYQGVGESTPQPHFYQNLGEAEYVVATFQYMRLLGYPAHRIAILTTYNGQRALIEDVLRARCEPYPLFGLPSQVATVDKFQGQQADYVLLSLVRTRSVGHVRDVRRLVVALSRARLGLYVFARQSLFQSCYELTPAFAQLAKLPNTLQLVVGEQFPTTRPAAAEQAAEPYEVRDAGHMGALVQQMLATAQ